MLSHTVWWNARVVNCDHISSVEIGEVFLLYIFFLILWCGLDQRYRTTFSEFAQTTKNHGGNTKRLYVTAGRFLTHDFRKKSSQGFFNVSSRSSTFEMGAAYLPAPFCIIKGGDLMLGQAASAKIRKKEPNLPK
jgi:hypothetical protein